MAGQLTIDTLKASSGVLATQNGMTGIAKAWVSFTGSTGVIRGSFNVSSITRNGTGDYSVAFTTTLPDANYSAVGTCGYTFGGAAMTQPSLYVAGGAGSNTSPTTTGFRFVTLRTSDFTIYDAYIVNMSVFD